jgi:uncharacterized phage-associated protein
LESGEFTQVSASLSNEDEKFVETIFDNYSKYSAFTLSDMTHEKDSPWDKVWNTNKTIGRLGLRIKNEEIREYFLNIKDSDTMH